MLFAACGSVLAFGSEKKAVEGQAPTRVQDAAAKCQMSTVTFAYHVSKGSILIFVFVFCFLFFCFIECFLLLFLNYSFNGTCLRCLRRK
jgi:hypothetical protein